LARAAWRCASKWLPGRIEEHLSPGDTLHLACLGLDLPLDTLYEDL